MPSTPTADGARTFRVIVRGSFGPLDGQQRERLLARLPEHDLMTVPAPETGLLYYDDALRAFSFRCVVRQPGDLPDSEAGIEAELRAAEALAVLGLPDRPVRASVTSVDDMRIRRRAHV